VHRPFLAAALFASLVAAACGSSGPSSLSGFDTTGPAQGSSGGDDASGTGGNDGGASGSPDASVSTSGGSGSSSGTSSGGTSSSGMSSRGPDAGDAALADAHHADASSAIGSDGGLLDSARQACVDRINMHRASIGLAPLARASASTEACSDRGAMSDATSNMAHSSAGMCAGTGAQDTCPSLPVGGGTGATLLSSLTQCLDQMWAEGPPPAGTSVTQCIQNYSGCFLQHGHYINMSDSYMVHSIVSCGFYQMSNGYYWGNQDLGP
jgi:hypothetical protein